MLFPIYFSKVLLYNDHMIRKFNYRIEPEYDSFSIREYLSLKGYPNAVFVQLKKTPESVLLNGEWAYMRTRISAGDELFIHLEENTSSAHILPVSLPLSICYEDEDILAVDKPAYMPIHPSLNHYDHTLANAVCGYYNDQNIPYTFRCVNRLDRDTTGLTLIAKHMLSSAILSTAAARYQGNISPLSPEKHLNLERSMLRSDAWMDRRSNARSTIKTENVPSHIMNALLITMVYLCCRCI